ncbi:VPA1267 family protein [Pseudoalteromonas marina]|uniref:VPA1267 family protein n=1 Tax=Pseudoalteromonas marina TaxID=267375 RepID=UPI0035C83FDB
MKETSGEKSVRLFNEWRTKQSRQDFVDYVRGGQLNRSQVAEACGFGRSAWGANENLMGDLLELENELREVGVFGVLTDLGKKELKGPKNIQKESMKAARQESRVPDLEQQITELKAENAALKGKFGRFSELSDTFADLGEL